MSQTKESVATGEADTPSRAVWQEPPALTLDERGMILDCSKAGEALFGYSRKDLVWHHVSRLLPELSEFQLLKDGKLNEQLAFLSRCGRPFCAINRIGTVFLIELNIVLLYVAGKGSIRVIVQPC
jgi:PAS domain S-box-containing protein